MASYQSEPVHRQRCAHVVIQVPRPYCIRESNHISRVFRFVWQDPHPDRPCVQTEVRMRHDWQSRSQTTVIDERGQPVPLPHRGVQLHPKRPKKSLHVSICKSPPYHPWVRQIRRSREGAGTHPPPSLGSPQMNQHDVQALQVAWSCGLAYSTSSARSEQARRA